LEIKNTNGNSAKFWLGLQNDFDVEEEMNKKAKEFKSIKKHKINTV
jgi:plasmid maintenance system antidote protein VapI